MFKGNDPIRENVTCDETWVYFYEPENRENNNVWIGENDRRSQNARGSRTVQQLIRMPYF